ncbi:putative integral membrane protein [Theileria parva strain Muguga]|uniref:Uncharacterized protein n=1 Tax=Theileria parva TaxID=5875 RepID=Q4N9H1_THEPA|nr:putative integral membrane protein [Theileria parva strain Muguga]EAN33387.1 putative integral membrane protein [Theileria parva strain Muguga]|eukprot:XP_765670.1 hypothetical protein [Theileria parva strain Muguga]
MKILNVVFLIYLFFNKLIFLTKIATFVQSLSIYDEILPLNLTGTRSYAVFDLFHDSDDYYPLGLSVKTINSTDKEFSVDDLIVFGKDVRIVFGDRCVSLSSFAKNITMSLSRDNLKYTVKINYDLQGSKITKRYKQTSATLPGDVKCFKFVEVIQGESDSDVLGKPALESFKALDVEHESETDEATGAGADRQSVFTTRPITAGTGRSITLYGPTPPATPSTQLEATPSTQREVTPAVQTPEPTTHRRSAGTSRPTFASSGSRAISLYSHHQLVSSTSDDTAASSEITVAPSSEISVTPSSEISVTPSKAIVTTSEPKTKSAQFIEVTKDDLSGTEGYVDAEVVKAGPLDFRCVLFKNTNNLYDKLSFNQYKLDLPKGAESFEICYTRSVPKTESISRASKNYRIVVSSQISSITVEQFYICKKEFFDSGLYPFHDYNFFQKLKTYPERRVKSDSNPASSSEFILNMDNFQPSDDSFLEKVNCGKCVVYRYIDGLEIDNRMGTVTALKFGNFNFKIPEGKRFIMASLCTQFLTTKHVTVMMRELFLYENRVFYSVDGSKYQERKFLEDEERLQLINLTSKVWHKRESNGKMGPIDNPVDDEVQVLCLNQFVKTNTPKIHKACKKLDKLDNFKLLFTDGNFTNLAFKKRAAKSSIIIGNVMFDLKTDNDEDQFIYISHPPNEPVNVLVLGPKSETHSVGEKDPGSNLFGPMTDSLAKVQPGSSKKHLNIGAYNTTMYDITWNFSDFLKKHYLYPSQFPQYCLGDIVFNNLRILSHKDEGYKHISATDRKQLTTVTVTTILGDSRLVLLVKVDAERNTVVEVLEQPTGQSD